MAIPLCARRDAQRRARVRTHTARAAVGAPRAERAFAVPVAALEGRRRQVLLLVESRRDPGASRPRRRGRTLSAFRAGVLVAVTLVACAAHAAPPRSWSRPRAKAMRT